VFSEIYYPRGWKITIDGQPAQMLRANYTLRALPISSGIHKVEFRFEPASIKVTDAVAFAALVVMLLTAVWIVFSEIKQNKRRQKQ
ncbi:MAG: YfhO family protein, partial [Petrimonas sp.]|nr:YfhO family protein [Petrimonas sp.]